MSPSTITLLFLAFAVVMFVWEKIPLALTAMIVCIGLTITGVLDAKNGLCRLCQQQRHPLCRHVHRRPGAL